MKSISSNVGRASYVLGAILGVFLFSLALFGHASGRLLGTVTDQSGAVISGAKVSIIDKDRGLARTLNTDAAGEYNAPNLIPGTYTPIFSNPFGSVNGLGGGSDPSSGTTFGCGCSTPDFAAGNPIVGSGENRTVQLGLKFTF